MPGAQVCAGSGRRAIIETRVFGDRLVNAAAAAHHGIRKARIRTDNAIATDRSLSHQKRHGQQLDIVFYLDVGADPYRGRIPHGNAGGHVTLVDAMLHGNTCLRKLDARINAHGLFGIVGDQGKHVAAVVAADFKHVGKVVLALRVVVRNAGKRVEKRRRIEAVETGVAFVDGSLFRRCVLLLDDAGNRIAFAFAHNATIPERIGPSSW